MDNTKGQGLVGEEDEGTAVIPGDDATADVEETDDSAEPEPHPELEAAEQAGDAGDEGEDWDPAKDKTPDMSADDPADPEEGAE